MAKSKFEKLSREMEEREGFGNSLIIFVIAALIVSALGWASIAELDNVTRGDGKIVSTTQNQMVQSSESGVILSRSVDENSLVQADDVLYEINPIELQSELDKLQQRAATLFVRELRLQAESKGLEYAPDASMKAQSADTAATEEALHLAKRKELSGIRKLAKERAKKASLHNKKLRDCRIHLTDLKNDRRLESTLFITEGDSASGSITKSRDVNTQAVFSLRGKPLNSFGMSKKIVYENEEFNLLQSALNIEESMEDLRYNNIVIATDADVDGMHIRLLLITFFLQFFPELIKENHLYILQTPLFRVRDKKQTIYCYSERERRAAIEALSGRPEITRFKGLGEISPDEFKHFIGEEIRLEPVLLDRAMSIDQLLDFYMGKNTPERQEFVIENLKVELDVINE